MLKITAIRTLLLSAVIAMVPLGSALALERSSAAVPKSGCTVVLQQWALCAFIPYSRAQDNLKSLYTIIEIKDRHDLLSYQDKFELSDEQIAGMGDYMDTLGHDRFYILFFEREFIEEHFAANTEEDAMWPPHFPIIPLNVSFIDKDLAIAVQDVSLAPDSFFDVFFDIEPPEVFSYVSFIIKRKSSFVNEVEFSHIKMNQPDLVS